MLRFQLKGFQLLKGFSILLVTSGSNSTKFSQRSDSIRGVTGIAFEGFGANEVLGVRLGRRDPWMGRWISWARVTFLEGDCKVLMAARWKMVIVVHSRVSNGLRVSGSIIAFFTAITWLSFILLYPSVLVQSMASSSHQKAFKSSSQSKERDRDLPPSDFRSSGSQLLIVDCDEDLNFFGYDFLPSVCFISGCFSHCGKPCDNFELVNDVSGLMFNKPDGKDSLLGSFLNQTVLDGGSVPSNSFQPTTLQAESVAGKDKGKEDEAVLVKDKVVVSNAAVKPGFRMMDPNSKDLDVEDLVLVRHHQSWVNKRGLNPIVTKRDVGSIQVPPIK